MSKVNCWYFIFIVFTSSGAPAFASDPVPVTTTIVKTETVSHEVILNGTVTSPKVSRLSVSTPGLVSALLVEEGDFVEQGDPLLQLDKELIELQWRSSNVAAEQARIAMNDAQRRLDEAKVLVTQKNIAATTVKDRVAELAEDKANFNRMLSDAAYQKALLDRHTLRAPFPGVISDRLTELGEWVSPGTGVYELVSKDDLRLDLSVSETLVANVAKNAQVSFTIAGMSDWIYQGTVQTIVPISDPQARTFLLRVAINAPKPDADNGDIKVLLPGMSVQAKLIISTGRQGIVVPRDAILRYPDGRILVWEIVRDNNIQTVEERQVKLGHSRNGYVEVTEGLIDGAVIVVRGNETLRQGQAVQVVLN